MSICCIRYAVYEDLEQVNALRKMVHSLHARGRQDVFREDFGRELQQRLYDQFTSVNADVIVAEKEGEICGFAVAEYISRPESPYNRARRYYHIEEFGVAEHFRRQGIAAALLNFCKEEAKAKGFPKLELDVWEFNQEALAFYESAGLSTYRRFMNITIE